MVSDFECHNLRWISNGASKHLSRFNYGIKKWLVWKFYSLTPIYILQCLFFVVSVFPYGPFSQSCDDEKSLPNSPWCGMDIYDLIQYLWPDPDSTN